MGRFLLNFDGEFSFDLDSDFCDLKIFKLSKAWLCDGWVF